MNFTTYNNITLFNINKHYKNNCNYNKVFQLFINVIFKNIRYKLTNRYSCLVK